MKTIPVRPAPAAAPKEPAVAPGAGPGGRAREPWRFSWLLAAPHRLGFFAGAVLMSVVSLWWTVVLVSRLMPGLAPPWAISPSLAHGVGMSFSFMPMFFVGFLYTAGPKWLGLGPVEARTLQAPVWAALAGWAAFLVGAHAWAPLAAAGVACVAAAWSALSLRFVGLVRRSEAIDRLHAKVIATACVVGALAQWAVAIGIAMEAWTAVYAALAVGLWWFLAPVYAAVLHRMIPFFTASALPMLDAWRPMWLLWTWLALLVAQVPLAMGLAAGATPFLALALDGGGAALLLWLAVRWGLVQSLKIRLLAMLHLGFVWLGVALVMQAASIAVAWWSRGTVDLGLAPLHAVTMGFLGSTLIAMVTRVSSGHGGRPLAADDYVWRLYWVLQVAVLLRMASAWWLGASMELVALAALVWTAVVVAWSARYISWYGRPRADGKPG